MRELRASIVRTLLPWVLAYGGPWAAKYLGLTEDQLSTLATLLIGAAYYVVVRLLERWVPQVGILLGSRLQPIYTRPGRTVRGEVVDPAGGGGIAA